MEKVKTLIKDFVDFIEEGCTSIEENERKLKSFCDKLLDSLPNLNLNDIKVYTCSNIVLSQKINKIKELVLERFPRFGHYSFTGYNSLENDDRQKNKLVVGNAIDDITAITSVFYEMLWRFENINNKDALFYLEDNFRNCWGGNLKNLQMYLNS
jgi:hypothetical protein